jgi:NAD(P)-dependent dehydrogenase (short-subunit alcohol dehydrogenase family)
MSSYSVSKLAGVKLVEFIAAEFPDIQVVTVHPGVVETAMNKKSELSDLPMDDGKITLEIDRTITDRT